MNARTFSRWSSPQWFLCAVSDLGPLFPLSALKLLTMTQRSGSTDLLDFLLERKQHPTHHIVIGNSAGDADSVVSAVCLAFLEKDSSTPIVSIPKSDLQYRRPETRLLFQLALGIQDPAELFLFVDSPTFVELYRKEPTNVTLVDHNIISDHYQTWNWTVCEIVDHHVDEKLYLDTCPPTPAGSRAIAFHDGQGLVASACTLVAERMASLLVHHAVSAETAPYPASVGLLLLGVILLDSVNLSVDAGKVTQRDRDAVDMLLRNTDWTELPQESRISLGIVDDENGADAVSLNETRLFDLLRDAKFDAVFWSSMSVRDSLRYDYKEFAASSVSVETDFGVSTVLVQLDQFFFKKDTLSEINGFMNDVVVDFLGIMFASLTNEGRLIRQLALCSKTTRNVSLSIIVKILMQSRRHQVALGLVTDGKLRGDDIVCALFDQQIVESSRKQIGPVLGKVLAKAAKLSKHKQES
jgi:exopolyphosphatase